MAGEGRVSSYRPQGCQAGVTGWGCPAARPSAQPRLGPHQALVLTVDADMAFSQHHVGDVLEVTEVGPWRLPRPVRRWAAQLLGLGFLPR